MQRFTPLLIDAARPCLHAVGSRWFVDETYVKVAGVWRYVYRAIDEHGQVIDVLVSNRRDIAAAHRFFAGAVLAHGTPKEVVTDRAAALTNVIAELIPDAVHNTGQYANNRIECDHDDSKRDCGPYAASRPTAPQASSSAATPSSRTSAAATTTWRRSATRTATRRGRVRRARDDDLNHEWDRGINAP